MLLSSADHALAAGVPYAFVFYNVNYSLNGSKFARRFNVEIADPYEYEYGDNLTWNWNGGPYTLAKLSGDTAGEFPVSPANRVPDFQFAGWTVYTGAAGAENGESGHFTDLGEGNTLDINAGIVADQFEQLVDWAWTKEGTGSSYLPLVGRWKLSDSASPLASAPLYNGGEAVTGIYRGSVYYPLYGTETADKPSADLETSKTDFDAGTHEYWLRVPAGSDTVGLSIIAPEPYVYDGATDTELAGLAGRRAGAYVSVNGGTEAKMTKTVLNDSTGAAPSWNRENSADYPARSRWTAEGLALGQTTAAKPYNDVTVTVVPPNGDEGKKTVYTFHIQRLGEPSLTADPGNTPSGMIMRESKITDKSAALAAFTATRKLTGSQFVNSTANNGGAVYGGLYGESAWAAGDPDLDSAAVVVYQNSAFTIPGFQVTDSLGNPVGGADYKNTMGYRLALRLQSKLAWGRDTAGTPGTVSYYDGTKLTTTISTPGVTTADGKITLDLGGKNVVPGIYSLEYSFTDPISGVTYTSDPNSFQVNKGNAARFKRALIVLPIPGDADMDGAVTVADALAMEAMLADGSAFAQALAAGDSTARLFARRVCDVNGDGSFDQSDIDAVWNGYAPRVTAASLDWSDYFYLPLPGAGSGGTRSAPAEKDGNKPVLTLDYLGKTPESFDPDRLSSGEALTRPADFGTGLELGDIFWVGVRLELPAGYSAAEGSALRMQLAAAAMSIAYDSALVKPVALNGRTWEETLEAYNIRSGAGGVFTPYMWSNDCTVLVGSAADKLPGLSGTYTTGVSKAILPLEATAGSGLRELRAAVRLKAGSAVFRSLSTAGDYLLLRVPFQVISHPNRATELRALGLSLGPKELSFAGLTSGGSGALLAALWDNTGGDPVFGGATANLAAQFSYGGGTALALKLGADRTEYQLLANSVNGGKTVYGEPFSVNAGTGGMTAEDRAGLPRGLSYTSTGGAPGYIVGIPEETGEFRFYVGGTPQKIVVEKAALDLTVAGQKIYYGESLSAPVFTYAAGQIKPLDRAGGLTWTGAESELARLSGYSAPTLSPVTALGGGDAVAAGTRVGKYYITLTGGSSANYTFRYMKNGYNTEGSFDGGYGKLEILPRPVVVEKLLRGESNPIATILYDSPKTQFTGVQGSYRSGDFSVRAGSAAAGMALTGFGVYGADELLVTYQANFIKIPGTDTETRFVLGAAVEYRSMAISALALKAGAGDNDNYVLVEPRLDTSTAVNAGKVFDRPARQVKITKGIGTSYNTGAYLYLSGMTIEITYEAESSTVTNTLSYSDRSSFTGSGVLVTWEERADAAAPTPGHDVMERADHTYFILSASAHNGKYIVVWVPTRADDGATGYVKAAVDAPLEVSKTRLTLTLARVGRYYGEENPAVPFTYRPEQLPQTAYDALAAALGHVPTGESTELEKLAGYTPPTIEVREGLYDPTATSPARTKEVTAGSPVPAGTYYSIIYGGGSDDFGFQYATVSSVDDRTDYGYQLFDVAPRPIVVGQVVMSAVNADSRYFLYDNTGLLQLRSVKTAAGTEAVTATSGGTEAGGERVDRFTAVLPANGDRTYFPAGGYQSAELKEGYTLRGDAIVNGDVLSLTYQANYTADTGRSEIPYFTLTQRIERRSVDIAGLALADKNTNRANGNYVLVYDDAYCAVDRLPKTRSALGTVKLRAIKGVRIVENPIGAYVYGSPLNLDQMVLELTFETEGDNAAYAAVQQRKFAAYVESGVIVGDSFADLGLHVGWAPLAGEGDTVAWAETHPAAHGSFPTVADDAGRQLVVYGRRHGEDPLLSAVTALPGGLAVAKKTLPLKVTPQYRYYGQPNPRYQYTFLLKDLAEPDRGKAAGHTLDGWADGLNTPAASDALSALGGYVGPRFAAAADERTDAGSGYPLALSGGGMDNYTFSVTDSTIRIFRRPILIEKITKSPVYTISRNNRAILFATSAGFDGSGGMEFTAKVPGSNSYQNNKYDEDYAVALSKKEISGALPLAGDAVKPWDAAAQAVGLSFTVQFPAPEGRTPILSGASSADQPVTVFGLQLTEGAKNYVLVYGDADAAAKRPVNAGATGRVDRRKIDAIKVTSVPKTSVYTYGEVLNISNLQVEISYKADLGEGGTVDFTEVVRADSRDGVYVNYYDRAVIPAAAADWQRVTDNYRLAANGDHLTVAPDHGIYLKSDGVTKKNFSQANGMYLIVSARTDDDAAQDFVRPVMVPASVQTGGYNPVGTYQLRVNPLALTFTLAAGGKVYDGNTQAVGTLALINAYRKNGVTDVVYAVTGAAYERSSTNYADYGDFLSHLSAKGYAFSTGSYDAATGFHYTGGSYGDGNKLTFAFVEPNVNYQSAPGWDSYGELAPRRAEVTGIRLGGADAANYTIAPQVLKDMAPTATRPAAPEAVIQKAVRAAPDVLPRLELDINTNAVQVSMGVDPSAYSPTNFIDEYAHELHYEYRLEGWAVDAVGTAAQGVPAGGYQDDPFFGGEPVAFPLPAGYEPIREPDPPKKDDIVKGQSYRWAQEDNLFGLDGSGLPLRGPLSRDWLYRAQVRLAETHNYLPSAPAASVGDGDLTAAAATAAAAAQEAAEALVKRAEGGMRRDRDKPPVYPAPAPMVKTYPQRLTVVSTADEQGKDGKRYTVTTLESVWFTDVLEYGRREVLSSVLENFDPVRYYRFFWDADRSKELEFKAEKPLDLGGELTVDIRERQADGSTVEKTVTVNPAELGGHSALLYATIRPDDSAVYIRTIDLSPGFIAAQVGDAPVQITAAYKPAYVTSKKLTWTSSNPAVAAVTADGLVSFLAPGSATITARAMGGATASIGVTVGAKVLYQGVFDRGLTKPFLTMTPELAFLPARVMNRGELVIMLARLYVDNPVWTRKGSGVFPDVTGREGYAAAAKLLGEKGIITGVTGGLFAAGSTATRAEMVVIIARMMGLEVKDTKGQPHAFSDAGEGDTWAYAYIDALAEAGIVKGSGGGRFNPGGTVTRAEAACMLARILDGELDLTRSGLVHPIDVPPTHWGYREIMRAVNGLPALTEKK